MQVPVETSDWRLGEKPSCSFGGGFLDSHRTLGDICSFFDFTTDPTDASRLGDNSLHIQNTNAFSEDEKLNETIKSESSSFAKSSSLATYSTHCETNESKDLFDMSSFFRDHEKLKNSPESEVYCGGSFEDLLDPNRTLSEGHCDQPSASTENVDENLMERDGSLDSVVMGIPYYVACQWQQMQQQQQQQQQAVMMLWWQAYLSGAYNMMGAKGGGNAATPTTAAATATTTGGVPTANQVGWTFPHTGLNFPTYSATPLGGDESLYHHMMMMDEDHTIGPNKRRRKLDSHGLNTTDGCPTITKKGRKSRQNERVCKNCGTNVTPFWRKDKQDGRPLCNACGLYLSKNDTPRPKVLWKYNERSPVVII